MKSIRGLYAIIDSTYVNLDRAGECAIELTGGGAKIIQLRAKDAGSAVMLKAAREIKEAVSGKALFIINDRIDIALLSGADGVHLGQEDIPVEEARRLLPSAVIGVSTHNIEEAEEAEKGGADYISFGPIFLTRTKKDADTPKGVSALSGIAAKAGIPLVAIGGITAGNAGECLRAGAASVAIISDILLSPDVRKKTALAVSSISKG